MSEAREILGTRGPADTIHAALADVVRRRRLQELAEQRFDDLTPKALANLRASR
ncbi:MAG: hypothetical protein M3377_10155 [Actinomycetota bacterium]|nr:hypothetical protein [Actinomycetota bacterium]